MSKKTIKIDEHGRFLLEQFSVKFSKVVFFIGQFHISSQILRKKSRRIEGAVSNKDAIKNAVKYFFWLVR